MDEYSGVLARRHEPACARQAVPNAAGLEPSHRLARLRLGLGAKADRAT